MKFVSWGVRRPFALASSGVLFEIFSIYYFLTKDVAIGVMTLWVGAVLILKLYVFPTRDEDEDEDEAEQ